MDRRARIKTLTSVPIVVIYEEHKKHVRSLHRQPLATKFLHTTKKPTGWMYFIKSLIDCFKQSL